MISKQLSALVRIAWVNRVSFTANSCNGEMKLLFAILCTLLTAACASQSEVPVSTIYQSQQCAITESQVLLLDSLEQLYAFVESAKKNQLPAGETTLVPPSADGRAVVVAWGRKPNSGYRLALDADTATISEDTLNLPVSFIVPASGQISAQVVTSPCIVLSVASREGYQWVQAGDLRMAASPEED